MKKLMNIVKRKEFIFLITVYPMIFLFANWGLKAALPWCREHPVYYSSLILLIASLMILYFLIEIGAKTFGYGIQGDKLKIRQKEGIDIDEIKNMNSGLK